MAKVESALSTAKFTSRGISIPGQGLLWGQMCQCHCSRLAGHLCRWPWQKLNPHSSTWMDTRLKEQL